MMKMKNIITSLIAKSGIPPFIGKKKFSDRLIVLMYHGITDHPLEVPDFCFLSAAVFDAQMAYLKENFNILPLYDALIKLKGNKIDKPTIAVTFDDGFQNNYECAYPILKKYGIPATIFLSTQLIDTDHTLWYCLLNQAISKTKRKIINWNGEEYNLQTLHNKIMASNTLQQSLKEFPHQQLLSELNQIIKYLFNGSDPETNTNTEFKILNSSTIRKMQKTRLIEFGSHTHSHAILSKLSKPEQEKEIQESIAITEKITQERCRLFSYPNGRPEDYKEETIKLLKRNNIEAAVTTIAGDNTYSTNPYELRRYGVGSSMSLDRFKILVHCDFSKFKSNRLIRKSHLFN